MRRHGTCLGEAPANGGGGGRLADPLHPRAFVVKRRRRSAALFALCLLAVGCRSDTHEQARRLLRVAPLLAAPAPQPVAVTGPLTVTPEARRLPVDLTTAEVARLRLRASGDASLLRLDWRLASEGSFTEFRHVNVPVVGDGEEHVYEIDLRREPYWSGRVVELALRTATGRLDVAALEGLGLGGADRVTSLHGLTVPSLPGAALLAVELPATAPRRARFTTWVGLLPRYDVAQVTARFRARFEPADGGEAVEWLMESFAGGGDGESSGGGWRRVSVPVRLPAAGGRLLLEAAAVRDDTTLPPGSAVWGAPMLLPDDAVETRRNLLLVVLDTVGAAAVGAWGDGSRASVTPHFDAFAAESVRFADLSAPSSWTLPSVASLLTGLAPEVHGAGRRIGDFAPTALAAALPTLAELLAAEGYYTAAVYNNIYMNPSFGIEQGFDEYAWVEDDDAAIVDRAIERLAEIAGRPHLLMVHLFGPHHPYAPPAESCARVAHALVPGYAGTLGCSAERRDVPTLDGVLPPEEDRAWIEALYLAELAHTDAQLGRLLAAVDDLGLRDSTAVLVVADHGEAFFDRIDQLAAGGYLQSDHGHTLFADLLHVPAALRVPGRAPAVAERAAELSDLLPTLLAQLDVEASPVAAGRDLLAELDGRPAVRRTLIASSLLYGPARWSARRGPWKLVAAAGAAGSRSGVADELYDLAADPAERHDVAADHPEVAANLRAVASRQLADRYALRQRLLSSDDDVVDSAYLEWVQITKLRALGYLN